MLRSLILAPMLMMAGEITDPGGWQQAKWGMTEQEVLDQVPGAVRLEPSRTRTFYKRTRERWPATIGIPSLRVVGFEMDVCFLFDAGRLARVVLQPADVRMADVQLYEKLEQELVAKYGRPFRRDAGSGMAADWNLASTRINLSLSVHRIGMTVSRFLYLDYTAERRGESKELL